MHIIIYYQSSAFVQECSLQNLGQSDIFCFHTHASLFIQQSPAVLSGWLQGLWDKLSCKRVSPNIKTLVYGCASSLNFSLLVNGFLHAAYASAPTPKTRCFNFPSRGLWEIVTRKGLRSEGLLKKVQREHLLLDSEIPPAHKVLGGYLKEGHILNILSKAHFLIYLLALHIYVIRKYHHISRVPRALLFW